MKNYLKSNHNHTYIQFVVSHRSRKNWSCNVRLQEGNGMISCHDLLGMSCISVFD